MNPPAAWLILFPSSVSGCTSFLGLLKWTFMTKDLRDIRTLSFFRAKRRKQGVENHWESLHLYVIPVSYAVVLAD